MAIWKATQDVKSGRTLPVPEHLRDNHYAGAKRLGRGEDYQYSHDFDGGYVQQTYLPEERRYYQPVDRGYEKMIRERLEELRRRAGDAQGQDES